MRAKETAVLVWTFIVAVLPSVSRQCSALSPDGWALLYFRSRIEVDPEGVLSSWNAYNEDPCNWFGIRCSEGNVVSIQLVGKSLHGYLGPELGQLRNLRQLVLRENSLTGRIPVELGQLENLEFLDLAFNNLTGQIPLELGNLSSLKSLYLENNKLEGSLLPVPGNFLNLYDVRLNTNRLIDIIQRSFISAYFHSNSENSVDITSSGLCNLKHLERANFSGNYLKGDIPICLLYLSGSSFHFNCLNEGTPLQRSFQDCSSNKHRILYDGAVVISPAAASPSQFAVSPGEVAQGPQVQFSDEEPSFNSKSVVPSPQPAPQTISPTTFDLASISASSERPSEERSTSSNWVKKFVIVAAVMGVLVSLFACTIVFFCFRHKGAAVRPWKSSMSGELQKGFKKGVPALSRAELEAACEDFSNIIGASPDCVLFKGTLSNGTEIAVTSIRMSAKSWSSSSELIFWKKVESLSQMKHKNLVNLVGYCAEEDPFTRMLIFEYASNGTVFDHIHYQESEHLDWATRMRIAMGVAYALEYMHHDVNPPVSHMNFDSNAVYLTDDYAAKLADFAVWKAAVVKNEPLRSSSRGNNYVQFDELEYSDRLVPDFENNIFSFGVFLLEIISGKLPYSKERGSLAVWAMDYVSSSEMIACIVDPTLKSYNQEELEKLFDVACRCVQTTRGLTMKMISSELRIALGITKEAASPKRSPLLWAELEILSQD
eukprot:c26572_g1_i2 orf=494-2635(-)